MKQNCVIFTLALLYTCVAICQSKPYYKWKLLDGDIKLFIENQTVYNWYEAMQECSLRNMTLITIDTPEKSEAITALLKSNFAKPTTYWTSGMDRGGSSTFIWSSTGKPLEFTNWRTGDPDNKKDQANGIVIGDNPDYEWLDHMCTTKNGIICEENRFLLGSRKDWDVKKEFIERLFSI